MIEVDAVVAMSTCIVLDADDWTALLAECNQLREVNSKLRDKLLELAKECTECGGTGCMTIKHLPPYPDTVEDCSVCLDIRELLA